MTTLLSEQRGFEIEALEKLAGGARRMHELLVQLSTHFSSPGWKDLFMRWARQQSECAVELRNKLEEYGQSASQPASSDMPLPADPEDEPIDPFSLDRVMLLHCVNHQTHMVHLFSDIRRHELPFDLRMLLQRHQLQARETLERLTTLYLIYPPKPGTPASTGTRGRTSERAA